MLNNDTYIFKGKKEKFLAERLAQLICKVLSKIGDVVKFQELQKLGTFKIFVRGRRVPEE